MNRFNFTRKTSTQLSGEVSLLTQLSGGEVFLDQSLCSYQRSVGSYTLLLNFGESALMVTQSIFKFKLG
jgi:hypothetical protein